MKILDIYSVDYKYIDLLRTKWPSTILEHKREKSPTMMKMELKK